MSSIMRRRSGETFWVEEFMAVLRLRDEADCLSSNRTEQSLRPHPSAGHRSKSPYRASGLVLRPEPAIQGSRFQTLEKRKADIGVPVLEKIVAETGDADSPAHDSRFCRRRGSLALSRDATNVRACSMNARSLGETCFRSGKYRNTPNVVGAYLASTSLRRPVSTCSRAIGSGTWANATPASAASSMLG